MVPWVVKKSKLREENSSMNSTELRNFNRSITPRTGLDVPLGTRSLPLVGTDGRGLREVPFTLY